jgi:hypothetical protein
MGRFPGGRRFALAIFDDTDAATVEKVAPVYRLLIDLGIRSTKSVWPLPNVPGASLGGATLDDPPYVEFLGTLAREGFELALHNVRNHDSTRDTTRIGLERFCERLGHYPRTHCNHYSNRENLYWGPDRLGRRLHRAVYSVATRFKRRRHFQGHVEDSEYFWGDLCRQHIDYVRNLVFDEINLEKVNPTLPYKDPRKPWVNFWFSSSDGGNVTRFCRLLSEQNQDRLEKEGGVCIVYTHFAARFCVNGSLDPDFKRLISRLATKAGWFVPVCELLDFLRGRQSDNCISGREQAAMERRWLAHKLQVGTR